MLDSGVWKYRPNRDALRRHWEWLRKWLLLSWKYCMVLLIAQFLLFSFINNEVVTTSTNSNAGVVNRDVSRQQAAPQEDVPTGKSIAVPAREDQAITSNEERWQAPCKGQVTSSYGMGWSEEFQDYRFQDYIKITAEAPIVEAIGSGEVRAIHRARGYSVEVQHEKGVVSVVSGLKSVAVEKGQKVNSGDPLGRITKGTYLKVQILQSGQAINPEKFINSKESQ